MLDTVQWPFTVFHVFPNFANLPPNFSQWWKNKMATDSCLLSVAMAQTEFGICLVYPTPVYCQWGI